MVHLKQNQLGAAWSLRSWAVSRRRALIGWSVLIVLFAMGTLTVGLPLSEDTVLLWLAAALFVSSLGDLKNSRSGVLRDWLPLYAVLALYSLLRGYASHVLWGPFVRPQLAFDTFIGLGTEPTAQLQQWLFNRNDLHWWDCHGLARLHSRPVRARLPPRAVGIPGSHDEDYPGGVAARWPEGSGGLVHQGQYVRQQHCCDALAARRLPHAALAVLLAPCQPAGAVAPGRLRPGHGLQSRLHR
jgi:hypothetical protein